MELSLFTDSVRELPVEEALDFAVKIGATAVEIATGGMSEALHLNLDELLNDPQQSSRYHDAITSRGLRIGALNCSAWALDPIKGEQQVAAIRSTLDLAKRWGVTKIVTMSGCPGDGPGSTTSNWLWYPWPPENAEIRERQWDQAIALWQDLAKYAADCGVDRIAFELHPGHLVYNIPTLIRMREAVGPSIGMNLDPSHLFWQQMDPIAVMRALPEAVYHVHLKDVELVPDQLGLAGVLDYRPFEVIGQRAWTFRALGLGHDETFWTNFVSSLHAIGYDDVLSIENEDPYMSVAEGVEQAARFIRPIMSAVAGGAA